MKVTDELVAQVFWNRSHILNDVLAETFGYFDNETMTYNYNPSMAEVREQLESISEDLEMYLILA